MSKWDFRSVLSLDMILIFRFGSIRESIEMKLGMGGLTEWIDVTLYCTLLMPNPTFIKKKKTNIGDPFFEETVSDISESDDLDEELEHITENVESLGT